MMVIWAHVVRACRDSMLIIQCMIMALTEHWTGMVVMPLYYMVVTLLCRSNFQVQVG